MMRISTRTHGVIDYVMAAVLILSPWIFGLSDSAAIWTLVGAGAVLLLAALMTDYELGLLHVIPMQAHLVMDGILGIFLILSPWLFGFAGSVWVLHVVLGVLELGGATMTQTKPAADLRQASTGR